MVPTSWLLSCFMNCDIYSDSDPWSSTITEQLLDRLVVEGNGSFTLFALLSLLQAKSGELLALDDASVLRDTLLHLPWGVIADDMPALIEKAEALVAMTPVSTLYAVYGVLSQCSPGLLPTTVEGSPELWTIRMTEFYKSDRVSVVRRSCFNPSKQSRVPSLLEQWQGKESVFEKACLKNYGVDRVLSRDIFYPSFSTMAREAGGFSPLLSCCRHRKEPCAGSGGE